jgi:hypothetical protein
MKKIAILLVFIWSCKNTDVEKDRVFDENLGIEYKSGVIVVEDEFPEVEEVSESIFLVRKSYFTSTPKVGEIVVVPGKLMHKVKGLTSKGDRFEMDLEPAKLNEVIENAHFDLKYAPQWTDAVSIKVEGQEVLGKGMRMMQEDTLKFKLNVSGIDYEIGFSPERTFDGRIRTCRFMISASRQGSTQLVAAGHATLPEQHVIIFMEDGKLKNFKLDNDGLVGEVELKMVTAGEDEVSNALALPKIALSIPFLPMLPSPIGPIPNPIPMSVDVGVQFTTQITMPDRFGTATGSSKISYSAAGGFNYGGSDVKVNGDLKKADFLSGTFDSSAGWGMPVDLQFGVAFPRVSFNLLFQEVAYFYVGYLMGSSLDWGPLCKRGYSKVVVEGGYKLEVLGVQLTSEKISFVEKDKRVNSGCD